MLLSEAVGWIIDQARRNGTQTAPPVDIKKVEAAMKLVGPGMPPAEAARQLGLGRSTVYREMRRLGVNRAA
ncbi:helix-turn-helix domain-containing protein [Phyllobacterium salinisoli]|uniref:helix-turn-helix domain-containing protein n=1 Tax=Phyllobacterium salinisoli TaxID=1899321 RepID=UPI001FDF1EF1|nr:helix-turn-helix domain-containing protein [Phyllobacterium salinisoli]